MSFNQDKKKFEQEIQKRIAKLVFATHSEVLKNTPVDTGRLRNSIVVEKDDQGNWIIGTNLPYAEFVELGMEPTIIRPKNKQALKFQIGGKTVFAKSVNHPGFEGSHMFLKAVNWAESNYMQYLK